MLWHNWWHLLHLPISYRLDYRKPKLILYTSNPYFHYMALREHCAGYLSFSRRRKINIFSNLLAKLSKNLLCWWNSAPGLLKALRYKCDEYLNHSLVVFRWRNNYFRRKWCHLFHYKSTKPPRSYLHILYYLCSGNNQDPKIQKYPPIAVLNILEAVLKLPAIALFSYAGCITNEAHVPQK